LIEASVGTLSAASTERQMAVIRMRRYLNIRWLWGVLAGVRYQFYLGSGPLAKLVPLHNGTLASKETKGIMLALDAGLPRFLLRRVALF
jgi:hypothetical protein